MVEEPPPPAPVAAATPPKQPEKKKRREDKPAPAAAPKAVATGTLMINAYPWAKVSLKGKELGVTPLELTLPVGDYSIELENPAELEGLMNAEAVLATCQSTDGLPLALELAGARARVEGLDVVDSTFGPAWSSRRPGNSKGTRWPFSPAPRPCFS